MEIHLTFPFALGFSACAQRAGLHWKLLLASRTSKASLLPGPHAGRPSEAVASVGDSCWSAGRTATPSRCCEQGGRRPFAPHGASVFPCPADLYLSSKDYGCLLEKGADQLLGSHGTFC